MPVLTEWVKQLVTVLILIGFLELILPENELKGAVKLVMGLFIITLLIQPLGKILKIPEQLAATPQLPIFNQSQHQVPATSRLIEQGLKLRTSWGKEFEKRNQAILKDKLGAILGMMGDFKVNRIDMSYTGTEPAKVSIDVSPVGPKDPEAELKLAPRIRNAVRLVTNLTEKNIEVKWHDSK